MAVDVLKYISRSDIERLRYEDEILAEIDHEAEIDYAVKQRNIEIAKILLDVGDSMEKITKVTGLSIDEIEKLMENNDR